ncbi:MAG: RHS repeat domain-containing protein [Candidatus Angelobacter sp.]
MPTWLHPSDCPSGRVIRVLTYLFCSALLATIVGSVVTYHNPDHLSDRAETDSAGSVTRTYGHFPFGETWYETGTADKWKFTSYARDTGESNLDYASFRYYGSGTGRFSSPDLLGGSLGNPESLNRYGYVGSDPVNAMDTTGLAPQRINCPVDIFGHCLVPDGHGGGRSCTADGSGIPCDMVSGLISGGDAIQCPDNDCSIRFDPSLGWHLPVHTGPDGQWQVYYPGVTSGVVPNPDYSKCAGQPDCPPYLIGVSTGGWGDYSDPAPAPGSRFQAGGAATAGVGTLVCLIFEPCGAFELGAIGLGTLYYVSGSREKDDEQACEAEWAWARDFCSKELKKPNPNRGLTGGYTEVENCARGFVSQACGGNAKR